MKLIPRICSASIAKLLRAEGNTAG
eukprot:COSAG04_NODE_14595_length_562_cov_0.794816_1_plen_24_part_01